MRMRHSHDLIRRRLLKRSAVDPATPVVEGCHCRVWDMKSRRGGYGRLWDGTRLVDGHRLSYEVNVQPIPAGMDVMHRCDNPPCIEAKHLKAGLPVENTADMIAKGRHLEGRRIGGEKRRGRPSHQRGSLSVRAKLTEDQAREIKSRLVGRRGRDKRKWPSRVALEFGVSLSLVLGIRDGRNWSWL